MMLRRTYILALLLLLLLVPLQNVYAANFENSSSISCTVVEDEKIYVVLEVQINKTIKINENVTISLFNLTRFAFKNNSLEFLSEIYDAYNKTIGEDLGGRVSFPVIKFTDNTNSVRIMFEISGIIYHPKMEKYGKTITLTNGYTFSTSWKSTKIDVKFKVSLPAYSEYNVSYVTWNSTDVFIFDSFSDYPIEKWNVTENNHVVANITMEDNKARLYGNISLPRSARYIELSGNNITYFYPTPIKENVIFYFAETGVITMLIGIGLIFITKRISYEKRFLKKIAKKKKKK